MAPGTIPPLDLTITPTSGSNASGFLDGRNWTTTTGGSSAQPVNTDTPDAGPRTALAMADWTVLGALVAVGLILAAMRKR